MIDVKLTEQNLKQVAKFAAMSVKNGLVVAYPTDTSYGLACNIFDKKALKKFYQIKERQTSKPVHLVVPSIKFAKSLVEWNSAAQKLSGKFWPGPISLILSLKREHYKNYKIFTGGTNFLGLRYPNNKFVQQFVSQLNQPITATSANPSAHLSGGVDSYSGKQVFDQFKHERCKPDIIIDSGRLPKVKPSTLVKIFGANSQIEILRTGPISSKQIFAAI